MTARPGKTRDRILDAALALFMERGVAGTTVTDIERAVGLAAGTGSFYRHFPSKDAVVVPAFERGVERLAAELDRERAPLAEVVDPHDRTAADFRSLLGQMRRMYPLWVLLMLERDQFPELEAVFVRVLGIGAWDLGWDEDPTRAVALAALTGYHQLAQLGGTPYGKLEPEEFVAALVALTERHAVER